MSKGEEYSSHLNFKVGFTKGIKASDQFVPTGRNADPKALICLSCNTDDCKKNPLNCKRFAEKLQELTCNNCKLVECNNCKHQYDCERTYLGQCTDGEEWGEGE